MAGGLTRLCRTWATGIAPAPRAPPSGRRSSCRTSTESLATSRPGWGASDAAAADGVVLGYLPRDHPYPRAVGRAARRLPLARIAYSGSPLATGKRPGTSDTHRHPGIGPGTPSTTWESRADPPRHTVHGGVRSQPDRQKRHKWLFSEVLTHPQALSAGPGTARLKV